MRRSESWAAMALVCVLLVLLPACGVVARAAEPRLIEAPDKIAPYKLVEARITGEWESALFSIEPEASVDSRTSSDGKLFTFVAPPGSYTVRVVCVNFTAKKLTQGKAVVMIGEPTPPTPPPPPVPPVPPPPPPNPGKLTAVVVEEQADRTAEQGVVLGSSRVRGAFASFRLVDKDATGPSDLVPYLAIAKDKPLPYLIIVQENGEGFWQGPLPKTIDELLKLVKP